MRIKPEYSKIELEFRDNFDREGENSREPEICGISEFCHRYTLCFWKKDSEGWYIQFVGDRPLSRDIDWEAFGDLCRYAQSVLDARYKLEEIYK